jgi:DNA-binding MurR/RpiR family transcriptional regulator
MSETASELPPRDYRSLRELLVSQRIKLPKRLAQVATYAVANPDEIAFGTVASVAEKAAVQPSALVRFSQAIGFQGFSDLQAVFQDRLRDRVSTYEDRLAALREDAGPTARTGVLFDGFCRAATSSVERLHGALDLGILERAAERLAAADTVYLLAQRRSYPVTAYMSYAFGKLGVKTVLAGSNVGTDPEILGFAGPRDAAVAISFTPYASATVAHARQIAGQGVPLVVITDSPFSPMVADTDLWFEVVEADFRGFRSLAAVMALAMTLTVAVADLRRQSI